MLAPGSKDLRIAQPQRGLVISTAAIQIGHRHILQIETYKGVAFSFGTGAMACSSALATVHRHIDGDGMACILD